MLFLLFAFGVWAVAFRASSSQLRVEQARVLRDSRTTFSANGSADAMRLLQTGDPPTDPYSCKLAVTEDGQTRYVLLTFARIGPSRWTVTSARTDESDPTIDAPATFFTVPATPTALGATAVSNSQIDLSWNDVKFDNGYIIQRSPNGSTGWTQIATTAKNVTSYSNTGLSTYTAYYYRVCATNSAGNSGWSNTATTSTMDVVPTDPSGLSAVAASNTQINLTWTDNAGNETDYRIERSPDGSTGWTEVGVVAANATAFSDTGLTANTTYFYRVRGTNALGNSGYSNTANTATLPNAPTAPTGLNAVASSSTQIDLTWADVAGETGYKIERSPDDSTWTQIATPAANATSYSDSAGLTASTAYYYRICATNAGGDSSYSTSANATTLPNPPGAPTALNATGANSSTMSLTWTDNANNETGFKIERSPDNATWSQINTVGANVVSYTDATGLSPSTTYYYRIRAYNAGGDSAYSTVDPGTTTAIPAIPTGLTPTVMSNTSVQLTWTDNSNNETGFSIERCSGNGCTNFAPVGTVGAGVNTFQNTGLTRNTWYRYRVRAFNATDTSAYSNVIQVRTPVR